MKKVISFGDSFTAGLGVDRNIEDTLKHAAAAEQRLNHKFNAA